MKVQVLQLLLAISASSVAAPAISLSKSFIKRQDTTGQYIVQLDATSTPESFASHLSRRDQNVKKVFQFGNFKAYVGTFSEEALAELTALPEVLSVEPDQIIHIERPPNEASVRRDLVTETNAPWHLGDISHKAAGSTDYVFDEGAGEGQTAYVLDGGIRISHEEFEGRAIFGYNALTDSTVQNGTNTDTDGHGTHVAGLIAGRRYGVARKATVVDVKILTESSGSSAWGMAGYNWAVNDIIAKGAQNTSVINLSLSATGPSTLWDNAVIAAYELGIASFAAAGNNDGPASEHTPARVPQSITVGMTDPDRSRTSIITDIYGSNWGPEVDVFAPGRDIVSADYLSDTSLHTRTGTSMATPITAGLACYLRALEGGLGSPEEIRARLVELAHKDVVKNPNGSPNLLVYNGSGQ
ncbi:subtilisin-like protein [Melanomma pulvis-pyrius CBS 109.77]|uniref:Subtilisin-like protein n=1 Tax=Melanomma pulvis-pyrius CBS 109.77 TaxID=1314802 RepID=A0A6A6XR47_9PLEO|nr:subtilisin-like protein [Melanomma pulvis-pyrius CBS 109.77]